MPEPRDFRVFLSAVSSEFETARNELANDFESRNVLVRIQRSFRQEADSDTLLRLLHDYISECTAVVCVMGKRSGSFPTAAEAMPFAHILSAGFSEASYTQWEFFFARHYKRRLSIYIARKGYKPDRDSNSTDRPELQEAFLTHVREQGLHRTEFSDIHELCRRVANEDWPPKIPRKPNNLPFASLGPLFKGRELFLEKLHTALIRTGAGKAAAVTGKALHGLGGVGKTRVAIEYALRHVDDYSALLFLRAESPERLDAGLAALAGADILDLPEQEAREDAVKISAVLGWLEQHPVWLMILDNVDDRKAAAAVEKLLPKLFGSRALITGRMTNFSASVEMLPLDVLDIGDATAFLLDRTKGRRAETPEDAALAQELAGKLGRLALGLEQAGAYIATRRIGIARYLKLWQENRAKVLHWFDKDLMAYDHDVGLAATWATSVEQLTAAGRRLLERLAFFAPEQVPESLLDVAVLHPLILSLSKDETGSSSPLQDEGANPNGTHAERRAQHASRPHAEEAPKAPSRSTRAAPADFDAHDALADLFAYSLASPVAAADGQAAAPAFAIHRLVQEFTQRELEGAKHKHVLEEALGWVNAAFVGQAQDVRSWPTLDPLAPHALALARHADEAGIPEPTARLMSQMGILFHVKSRYAEAEPLMRRALAIAEASYGPDHPKVAIRLNNLASLLQNTNRLAEAEPLMRRALAIDEASHGRDHPNVATDLNNLAGLLLATNRLAEAEPLYRHVLAIFEASHGPDHPTVATSLNNLAQLLQATNRLADAEPLMRRALAIDEASYGPDHPDVAIALDNLAQLLKDTNRLAEAEPLMRRALAIDEASYGPDHPDVAIRLNNLAGLLQDTNRLAEAEPLMRRALAIDEASLGPDHPKVATSLNNLAGLLRITNRLMEAEPLMRRALAIIEACYGPDHPRVATAYNNLAQLLQATNRLAEAEPLMRRHVEIFLSFTAWTGHQHPNLLASFGNYAGLLVAMGRSKAKARAAVKALAREHGVKL